MDKPKEIKKPKFNPNALKGSKPTNKFNVNIKPQNIRPQGRGR